MSVVVHVDNRSASGAFVDAAQEEMRRLRNAGYSVAPVPADDREHRYGVCPTCGQAEGDLLPSVPTAMSQAAAIRLAARVVRDRDGQVSADAVIGYLASRGRPGVDVRRVNEELKRHRLRVLRVEAS